MFALRKFYWSKVRLKGSNIKESTCYGEKTINALIPKVVAHSMLTKEKRKKKFFMSQALVSGYLKILGMSS